MFKVEPLQRPEEPEVYEVSEVSGTCPNAF